MRLAVGIANLVLGVVYTSYGIMTAIEMKRGWRTLGFSHFGAAWIAMAFTCGPHHLFHGVHALAGGRAGGGLDLAAVAFGFPAGVAWFLLRVEAFRGGRGDRFASGSPLWILSMPTVTAAFVTAFIVAAYARMHASASFTALVVPNVLLLFLYCTIGYFLTRTQLRTHKELGGWSVSGVTLAMVFPTCGIMHIAFMVYSVTGLYHFAAHDFYVDWLAVPAAVYFLLVVRQLYREAIRDWNSTPAATSLLAK